MPGLELPRFPDAQTEAPGILGLAHPPTFAITWEHVGNAATAESLERS
ncbi:MAG: hypothetical protein M3P43_00360 [Actinomycetota bacterium]|nr:hypothetical protein [Actinomycetota bacterium]